MTAARKTRPVRASGGPTKRKPGGRKRRVPGEPLYVRIARKLRDGILSGAYPVGSLLPTEEMLCREYSVSRHTVREALRQLRDDSLISSRRGAGTIVIPPQAPDANFVHAMSIDDVLSFSSRRWDFEIDRIEMDLPRSCLGEWLGPAGDEQWLAVSGVAHTKGSVLPECWMQLCINREFAAIGDSLRGHSGPIVTLIEERFGETVTDLDQEITAGLITPDLAELLQVEPGSPGIVVLRACRNGDGKILQANVEVYPASRFRYSVTLRRERQPARH